MERKLILVVFLVAATWTHSTGQQTNLLQNPSFEEDLRNIWKGNNFQPQRYSRDAVDGEYSVKCSNRRTIVAGMFQDFNIVGKGGHFAFEGYVKLLNAKRGTLWQHIRVVLVFNFANEDQKRGYVIAHRGFATPEKGWIRVNGSCEGPMKDFDSARLIIRGPDPEVTFLVDSVKLYEVPENPNWREQADSNIEKFRKSNINFNVNVPSGVNTADVELEISLTKHLFAFGNRVTEAQYGLNPPTKYEYYFNRWFNWGAVQSYKWKFGTNSRDPNFKDYSRATNATDQLIANGKTVRGHTVLWDFEDNNPAWIPELKDSELVEVVDNRILDVMNLAKGKVAQMDVQNEHVGGHYFEERLQDPDFTKMAFRKAKQADPNGPVLYLNDFTCVTSGANTEDMYDLGMSYQKEGIPIEGLGCQGHVKDFVKPNPTAMWRRLDRLAMTGLDLMMTEFDIGWPNRTERAQWLEDAIRAFYGHPALKGVILWGFWDGDMRDIDHELVAGPDPNTLTVRESGKRFSCLVNNEWMTRETRKLSTSGRRFVIRGFQGDYIVIVKNKGVPVQTVNFSLGKKDATVNIRITKNTNRIQVEPLKSLEENCASTGPIGEREDPEPGLECRTVVSKSSGTNENDSASARCGSTEVMTGCFSYHTSKSWTRLGERVEVKKGKVRCVAYNGPASSTGSTPGRRRKSNKGVKAIARCCRKLDLVCRYPSSGPSTAKEDATAVSQCHSDELALGCSAYQPIPALKGAMPEEQGGMTRCCKAVAGAPIGGATGGATVSAVCCSAGRQLSCSVVKSKTSKLRMRASVSVGCPEGDVMTGCNVFAASGKSAGARISIKKTTKREICKAFLGADLPSGSTGVQAVATCCRLSDTA